MKKIVHAKITVAAVFPEGFFLENLVACSDQSLLISVVNRKEVWYVPPLHPRLPVEPVLLASFEQSCSGIVEVKPNVFLVCASNLYTSHEAFLYKLDLSSWQLGRTVEPELVVQFPTSARSLNCSCMLHSDSLLVSDGFGSRIWRVDLGSQGAAPKVQVWLEHETMAYFPGREKPDQPGVNGLRYVPSLNTLYYTSTAKKLVMRVAVASGTLEPCGEPELVAAERMGDDFCVDDGVRALFVASHRNNTIDRIDLDPTQNIGPVQSVAGVPFTTDLIGPTSGVWGRGTGDHGKIAYFTTDGGIASPPSGVGVQPSKVLKVELL